MEILKKDINTLTKADINEATNSLVASVNEGYTDACEVLALAKRMEDIAKALIKGCESVGADEVGDSKGLVIKGVEFTTRYGRDYPQYEEDEEYKRLKELLKAREAELKIALSTTNTVVDDSGEVIPRVSVKLGKLQLVKKLI